MSQLFYVARDEEGLVSTISSSPISGHEETLPSDHPDIIRFVACGSSEKCTNMGLILTDLNMMRIVEDLIELLVQKNVIKLTDLPDEAAEKLLERHRLRGNENGFQLIGDEDII